MKHLKPLPWSPRRKIRKSVLAHLPRPRNKHPQGEPWAYCFCGEAICRLGGSRYWHIYRFPRSASKTQRKGGE